MLKRVEYGPNGRQFVPVKQTFTDKLKFKLASSALILNMFTQNDLEFIQISGKCVNNGKETKRYSHEFVPHKHEIVTEVETSKDGIRSRKTIRTPLDNETIAQLNKTKETPMKSETLRLYVESKLGI